MITFICQSSVLLYMLRNQLHDNLYLKFLFYCTCYGINFMITFTCQSSVLLYLLRNQLHDNIYLSILCSIIRVTESISWQHRKPWYLYGERNEGRMTECFIEPVNSVIHVAYSYRGCVCTDTALDKFLFTLES